MTKKTLIALLAIIFFLNETMPALGQKKYKMVVDCQYELPYSFASNGLAAVKKNGKYGYIDRAGKTIIDFQYDLADNFMDNGLALVEQNQEMSGYRVVTSNYLINQSGRVVVSLSDYSIVNSFIDGFSRVSRDGKWGLIDQSGKLIVDCQYEYISPVIDENLIEVKKDGKTGFIDKTGKAVIDCQFEEVGDFSKNGLARVLKNGKWGFIDKSGKIAIDCQFDEVKEHAENGLAAAKKGDKWGFINLKGKTVIGFQFNSVIHFADNGLAGANKDGKRGYIDQNGKVVIDYQYESVGTFSPFNTAVVKKGGKWGFIDRTGKLIADCQYDEITNFFTDGMVSMKKDGKWGMLDKDGKLVIDPLYDEYFYFSGNGLATVKKDGKYGFINIAGKQVISCQFDKVEYFRDGLCAVMKGDKWGYIDETGEIVIGIQFDYAGSAFNGIVNVGKNGRYGFLMQVDPQKEIEDYVKPEFATWQQKGKYEPSSAYLERVSESNSRKKAEELMLAAIQKVAPTYCDWTTISDEYDADNQTFKVNVSGIPPFYVKVPSTEAEAFDTSIGKLSFSDIQYAMSTGGDFFLKKASITNPVNGKTYSYSSTDNAVFASTQLNINLDPTKFNIQTSENAQTVKTENKTLTVGQSDVDVNIPVNPQTSSNTFAVIIANESYQKEVKVKFAANDGKVFRDYCEKTLGIPSQNIHLVTDATFGNMKSEIKWITDVIAAYKGQARVIFYYAGHGMPNEQDKSAYLLPVDGFSSDFETAIKLNDLYSRLTASPSQSVTFILDACFSGSARDNGMLAEARGVKVKPRAEALNGNSIVFSAASGDETAYPYTTKQHGLFTYFLLKKLQETNGNATYKDLIEYIKTNVEQQSVVVNQKSQTPQVQASQSLPGWEEMKMK